MDLSSTPPLWVLALVLAGLAPWLVKLFADGLEQRARRRTEALLAHAATPVTAGMSQAHLARTMPRGVASAERPVAPESADGG